MDNKVTIAPLNTNTWGDFETLFTTSRTCSGCWCTWFRLPGPEYRSMSNEDKHLYMRTLVQSGKEPGLLAYVGGVPAGWVSVAPRAEFTLLARSKKLASVDDQPVWSINCFFTDRHYRGLGLTRQLIQAAVQFAVDHGATILEAYPIDTKGKVENGSLFYGLAETFRQLGFVEVARRSERQPIMRLIAKN
ncbi:MAG: GNAT family N-acetyltransferase [Anaerolineaceae bacterium]|nr:GNAT family N-acetyltransferase [Anaerolineaceae bacterium]